MLVVEPRTKKREAVALVAGVERAGGRVLGMVLVRVSGHRSLPVERAASAPAAPWWRAGRQAAHGRPSGGNMSPDASSRARRRARRARRGRRPLESASPASPTPPRTGSAVEGRQRRRPAARERAAPTVPGADGRPPEQSPEPAASVPADPPTPSAPSAPSTPAARSWRPGVALTGDPLGDPVRGSTRGRPPRWRRVLDGSDRPDVSPAVPHRADRDGLGARSAGRSRCGRAPLSPRAGAAQTPAEAPVPAQGTPAAPAGDIRWEPPSLFVSERWATPADAAPFVDLFQARIPAVPLEPLNEVRRDGGSDGTPNHAPTGTANSSAERKGNGHETPRGDDERTSRPEPDVSRR